METNVEADILKHKEKKDKLDADSLNNYDLQHGCKQAIPTHHNFQI